ncbi:TonB-dependent receptor [Aquimarina addita]|uniref:TonB-dependent receptor n=1 Tax=Aquimarina addita TaxID=870485 RepID=A0ABP6UPJ5_9FLAO
MKAHYKFHVLYKAVFLDIKSKLLAVLCCVGCISVTFASPTEIFPKISQEVQQNITGVVKDKAGTPLAGVNVLVKGEMKGTTTDFDGKFSIAFQAGKTLVFYYIGFSTKEVELTENKPLTIVLENDISQLDEIVVIGYGSVKKSDLTGAVTSVSEKDFPKGAQSSLLNVIQGKAAGVQITQQSASPGGGFSVRIRGAGSITAGNEPLYVIDGLPRDPSNAINPGDIESIEILKDASATAIYGSRGANGVVLITTKKGKEGKVKINYSTYYSVQNVAKRLDLLNGTEYANFINDISTDNNQSAIFTQEEISQIGEGTDWWDQVLGTASVINHQVSVSGGSNNTNYYLSLNHFDEEGIILNTGFQRTMARVNINHESKNYKFGINLNTSLVQDQDVPYGDINAAAGVITTALQMDPTLPVFDENGDYSESMIIDLDNPLAQAETISILARTNRTFGNAYFEYSFLDELSAKINLANDRSTGRTDTYISSVTKRGQASNGSAGIASSESWSNLLEFTVNYNDIIAEDHSINAVLGYSYQDFNNRGFGAGSSNFPTDAFLTNNLGAGDQERFTVSSERSKNQLLSYLGRVNYGFKDKYLATFSFRIDGSSRFGIDEKYGYFPSLALAWKLKNESFLANVDFISSLKLRSSYGITGNQEIGNYNSLVLLGTTGDAVFNGQQFESIAPSQLENPDLKWERTGQLNIGLDFGFFNDRINGSIEYYKKKTSDLLLALPIPETSGFGSSLQNIGDVENSGLEFLLETKNFIGDFNWSTSLNLSTLKNEVTNLGELPLILGGSLRFLPESTIIRVGDPINSFYGYNVDGIFQTQDEVNNSAQPDANPGDIRYTDSNGDGIINVDDRVILGDGFPDFFFGITNTFSYKNLSLNLFFQGVLGAERLNYTRIDTENPIELRRNRQSYVLDRWTPENPSTEHPSFLTNDFSRAINSRVVEDGSYFRLREITLSYNFQHLNNKFINDFSIYVTGQNLFTITDYTGFNPDIGGTDYNSYPLSKIYTLGVNINF